MEPNQVQNSVVSHPRTNAKDFFLHLGTMVALYSVAISLVNLLFTVINKAYPQVTGYNYAVYSNSYSISFPVSMIIIMFPIFILLMWLLEKTYITEPEKRNLGIKKWLTYITLFVSGLITTGDLITVVYYFIDGQELTTGFLLKVLSVFSVSFLVFMYYITDIRGKLSSMSRKVWVIASAVVILGAIITGFSVLGSPRTQQLIKYDTQKVSALQNLNNEISYYYQLNKSLPEKISDLPNTYLQFVDQQSQKPFDYKKTGDMTYELCADFNKDSKESGTQVSMPVYYDGYNRVTQASWEHPAGQYCFMRTVVPVQENKPTVIYN